METWSEFRSVISAWAKLEIDDAEFYRYLVCSEFENAADRRVANIFITQHDNGEWSHAIYHRM
jgi:hypothetical protein